MKKRNDDIRLECVNWDAEQPATIKCKGLGHAVSRKVLTKAKVAESRVTPDTTVECPKCGHRFRVGRKLA